MRKFFNILVTVFTVVNFSSAPVFSADAETGGGEMITGILVKVDVKKLAVYVRENSRIVKFKASSDICEKFRNRINSEVDIRYIIASKSGGKSGNKKVLQIVSMVLSEKRDNEATEQEKSRAAIKDVKKKK